MIAEIKSKFALGQVVGTPAALEALEMSGQSAAEFLNRHVSGDWGEVDAEDQQANEQALIDGTRVLSAYRTSNGERLWIITEAADERGRRAATTILLPSEY